MANPYQMFETDATLETEGIILDYGDFRVRVAHAGNSNKKYTKAIELRIHKQYKKQLENELMDPEVLKRLMREIYADTIILNFEVQRENKAVDGGVEYVSGVPSRTGELQPYNRDTVIRIMTDLPKLFEDVQKQATDFALYRTNEIEEQAKK